MGRSSSEVFAALERLLRHLRRVLTSCMLLAVVTSCAPFVPVADYQDYRATRLATNNETRLLALQHYVAAHPSGHFIGDVRDERARNEPRVFESGKSDRAGLELYLAAYPDGRFVEQARARLGAIAVIEQRKASERQRASELQAEQEQRAAELGRTWITRFIGYWSKTLLGLSRWGSPIAQVAGQNPEFSRAFGRPPRPRCTEEECVKYYDSTFAIPVPGATRLEREMRLILRLRLTESKLVRAELLLPDRGFSRWKELESREPVSEGDATARAAAVEFARSRLEPIWNELARDRQPLKAFTLRPFAPLQIDPSGERVDTSVEDPGAPANRIQGSGNTGRPDASEPSVAAMLKPKKEATPDMVLAPIAVDSAGRARTPAEAADAAATSSPAGGEVMDLGPVVVPRVASPTADAALAPPPSGPARPAPAPAPATERNPGFTQAFIVHGLRVVVFAAASDAPAPAYDGLVIESSAAPAGR